MWIRAFGLLCVFLPALTLAQECSDSTSADVIFVLDGGQTGSTFITQQRNFVKFVARYLKVSVSPSSVGAIIADDLNATPVSSEIISLTTNLTDFETAIDSLTTAATVTTSNLYVSEIYTSASTEFGSGSNTGNRYLVYMFSASYTDVSSLVLAQVLSAISGTTEIGVNFETRVDVATDSSFFAFSGTQLAALAKGVAATICDQDTLNAPTVPTTTVSTSTSTAATTTAAATTVTTTAAATTAAATTTAAAATTTTPVATTAAATTTASTTTAAAASTTTPVATTAAATTAAATTTAAAASTTTPVATTAAATTAAATTTAAAASTTTPVATTAAATTAAATTTAVVASTTTPVTMAAAATTAAATTTTATASTTTPGPAEQCTSGTYDGVVNTYNFYPGDCSKFYQCWKNGLINRYEVRQCALGEVFSMTALDCILPNDVRITCDVCPGTTSGRFQYSQTCGAYWFCSNGAATASCCGSNQRFDSTTSTCVSDTSCTSSCSLTAFSPALLTQSSCRLTPSPDIESFQEEIFFGFTITRKCPAGTVFVPPICQCDHIDTQGELSSSGAHQGGISCSVDVDIPFTTDVKDVSPKNIFVSKSGGVTVSGGAAAFDGSGKLTLWRYASMDWPQGIAITLRIRPDASSTDSQVLLSNCNCWSDPSIMMSVVKQDNSPAYSITLEASISNSPMERLTFITSESGYIDVTFRYDNTNLVGVVGGMEQTIRKPGALSISNGAFYIGGVDCPSKCGGLGGFTGSIDQVKIYKCGN